MDYTRVAVIEALPDFLHGPQGAEPLFGRMAGATLLRIGTLNTAGLEGGGLVIDYRPAGEPRARRRAVFGFNELGLWPEWEGPIPIPDDAQESLSVASWGSPPAGNTPAASHRST
jgi:hypothetical protein